MRSTHSAGKITVSVSRWKADLINSISRASERDRDLSRRETRQDFVADCVYKSASHSIRNKFCEGLRVSFFAYPAWSRSLTSSVVGVNESPSKVILLSFARRVRSELANQNSRKRVKPTKFTEVYKSSNPCSVIITVYCNVINLAIIPLHHFPIAYLRI